jgi:hypothetical protein
MPLLATDIPLAASNKGRLDEIDKGLKEPEEVNFDLKLMDIVSYH